MVNILQTTFWHAFTWWTSDPNGWIDKSTLVQVMAWRRTGDKPLPETMSSLGHNELRVVPVRAPSNPRIYAICMEILLLKLRKKLADITLSEYWIQMSLWVYRCLCQSGIILTWLSCHCIIHWQYVICHLYAIFRHEFIIVTHVLSIDFLWHVLSRPDWDKNDCRVVLPYSCLHETLFSWGLLNSCCTYKNISQ